MLRLLLLSCMFMGSAYGATLSVEADGSGNYSTLQEALAVATDGDLIEVGPGTYTGLIETQGLGVHIRSTDGASSTLLDGGGGEAVLAFGAEDGPDTVIEGFRLTNAGGRGLVATDASPTLIDLEFVGLGASDLLGGAVQILRGSPSFEGCSFLENVAELGGAIHVQEATLSLKACVFEENEADYGGALWGSAISFVDEGSTYDFNVATYRGGAVHLEGGGDGVVSDGRFWSNESGENGGAVSAKDGYSSLSFTNVEFTSNETYGSGGAVFAESLYGPLHFEGCDFDSNDGLYDYGGAIYAWNYIDLSVIDSVFEGHVAYYRGGAIYSHYYGSFTCEESVFEDNHCLNYSGGAVHVRDHYSIGDVDVLGCQFIENHTLYEGGGLYVEDVDNVRIERSFFQENHAGDQSPGGGVSLFRSKQTVVRNNTFLANRAGYGGGFNSQEASSIAGPHLLENNLFVENVARVGGGLLLTESPRPRDELDYGGEWSNKSESVNRFYLLEDEDAPEGDWSLAAEWDFSAVEGDDGYVVFYTPILELPEVMPQTFRIQVYSPHTDWQFIGRLVDGTGETFYGWFGDVDWTGWQEVEIANVPTWGSWGGNNDDVFDLPITQVTLQVQAASGVSGTVRFDDLRVDTEEDGEVFLTGWEQEKWPVSIHNNSFVANHALDEGGAVNAWNTSSDFRNNLVVSSGGGSALDFLDALSQEDWKLSYNGFYGNEKGDYPEGVDNVDGVYADPELAQYSQDGEMEGDHFVFLQGSPFVDAGDPDLLDPDGSRSDLGANGGPGALWVDEDGDGYHSGVDCDDSDPAVFPGAEELFYDGINQDCSMGSDFDADEDGEDAESYGGEDCDDEDPSLQFDCSPEETGDSSSGPDGEESEDCGCVSQKGPSGSSFWLMAILLVLRRRRQRS